MKKYEQFINEAKLHTDKINHKLPLEFSFNIEVRDSNSTHIIKQKQLFIKEVNKYFLGIEDYKIFMKNFFKENIYYISIKLHESCGNGGMYRNTITIETQYDITIPKNLLITLETFLEIGFEGIETYFDAKNFNL